MPISKVFAGLAVGVTTGAALMALTTPASAAPAAPVDAAQPAPDTGPGQPQPRSAAGSTAIGAFTYSAGGLTIKIPAGCFLTHAISGKGTKIDSQRAGVDCVGPSALAAKFCNTRIEFHYADVNNKTYRIDKGPLNSSCKTGTVPMLRKGAKSVKVGKACAQLWVNGQRKAVQCHYITK